MSIKDINNDPEMLKKWIDDYRARDEQYLAEHPDSLLPDFEKEIRDLGFQFLMRENILDFMPKQKKEILPIAIKYYNLAKECGRDNEQNYFLGFFHCNGLEEVIPMLLEDYYSNETKDLTRWFISDCLYQIRSKKYIAEYIKIVSNPKFARNRQLIVLLLGKLKVESAIPVLIELLEDEDVRLHAIDSLGQFKREEFRCHFERFENSPHYGWRKNARTALKKLDKVKSSAVE